jgi:hypothetical protein
VSITESPITRYALSWTELFAIGGFIAFLGLLLSALSDHIYKSED